MPPEALFLEFLRKPPEAEGHEITNKKLGVLLGFFLGFFGINVLAVCIACIEVFAWF
jgi:hypothetical protein